ncbi:UNVERIFIED_CONTAM: Vacuolar protein-sorting-associated protein 28, partial [Siphonaria sp. JEL0065]
MDTLIKLTQKETESLDSSADLFSILVTTEALEKAYIRDAVAANDYTAQCTRLIGQFKAARDLLPPGTNIDVFMREYKLSCPAATKRLIEIGVPATVEHAVAETGASGRAHVKTVADITTCFITILDYIKLNMTAVDQLHPLLAELIQFLNKIQGLPKEFEELHKDQNTLGLAATETVGKVFVAPGNGGTETAGSKIVNVNLTEFSDLVKFAVENK